MKLHMAVVGNRAWQYVQPLQSELYSHTKPGHREPIIH